MQVSSDLPDNRLSGYVSANRPLQSVKVHPKDMTVLLVHFVRSGYRALIEVHGALTIALHASNFIQFYTKKNVATLVKVNRTGIQGIATLTHMPLHTINTNDYTLMSCDFF